jgi:hypothetical protein
MLDSSEVNFRGRSLIVSRVSGRSAWLALACLIMFSGFVALIGASSAKADDTVWICKPGQSDDLCAGTIAGKTNPVPGQPSVPLEYTRPKNAPIDCFYLYPTQSEQSTPNSNLDKDPPIRRVVVQQARMFSSVCKVYAPMYHQVTYSGNQAAYNPDVETAYQSAKAGFEDYLKNYNKGRGFIMIGHSQGSAMTGRLIDELVDTNADLRKRFVGAIAPGANIYVPKNKFVGGMYANVPACSEVGQYQCLIAYSTYKGDPGATPMFSSLSSGYWIYPEARPDPTKYEAVCTNPAQLDGGDGTLLPLANYDYLLSTPAEETAAPWQSQPDYYKAACERSATSHWLNISRIDDSDPRLDLGQAVASGNNYHVPEVNLAEGNLLSIASMWSDDYTTEQTRVARLNKKIKSLNGQLTKVKKALAKSVKKVGKLKKKAKKASGSQRRTIVVHIRAEQDRIKKDRKQIKALKKRITGLKKQRTG